MSWRAARQALDGAKTMDPVAQQSDPVLADITSCSRFLNATLVSGALATIGVVIRIAACWYSWIHIGTSTRCNRVLGNDSCPQSPVRGSSPERANLQLGTRSNFRTPLLGTSLTLCRMARIAKSDGTCCYRSRPEFGRSGAANESVAAAQTKFAESLVSPLPLYFGIYG